MFIFIFDFLGSGSEKKVIKGENGTKNKKGWIQKRCLLKNFLFSYRFFFYFLRKAFFLFWIKNFIRWVAMPKEKDQSTGKKVKPFRLSNFLAKCCVFFLFAASVSNNNHKNHENLKRTFFKRQKYTNAGFFF